MLATWRLWQQQNVPNPLATRHETSAAPRPGKGVASAPSSPSSLTTWRCSKRSTMENSSSTGFEIVIYGLSSSVKPPFPMGRSNGKQRRLHANCVCSARIDSSKRLLKHTATKLPNEGVLPLRQSWQHKTPARNNLCKSRLEIFAGNEEIARLYHGFCSVGGFER